MTDRERLIYNAARALDAARMASEEQQATDKAHSTPEIAGRHHWDAAALLRRVGEAFVDLADQHTFAARRMERAAQEEKRTGHEYRLGPAA